MGIIKRCGVTLFLLIANKRVMCILKLVVGIILGTPKVSINYWPLPNVMDEPWVPAFRLPASPHFFNSGTTNFFLLKGSSPPKSQTVFHNLAALVLLKDENRFINFNFNSRSTTGSLLVFCLKLKNLWIERPAKYGGCTDESKVFLYW